MELRQLKYFIEVARKEHVTRAAEKLHVAQSAVSRQIANLEEELGVKLFTREGRRVKLTPIGINFLHRVERAMDELDKALEEVNEYLDPEVDEIRIGFPHSLATYSLPTAISTFRKKHPSIRFQLRQGITSSLIKDVIKGELDIALVTPVPTNHPEVHCHILFTEEMKAILPQNHPLAENKSIRLIQLEKEPFIIFRTGFTLRTIVMDACAQAGFKPKIAFEGEETSTIRGMVATGLGVSLLPEVALVERGPMDPVIVEVTEPRVQRTVGFVTSRTRKPSPSEKIFQHFLWEFYKAKK